MCRARRSCERGSRRHGRSGRITCTQHAETQTEKTKWTDAEPGSKAAADCKETCSLCPVRLTCAITALITDESYGVWGGMDRVDREALKHSDAQIAA
ncbi:WhiB family transcriptional regulator [Actinophytocola glycyrrhizae]|uniref:WhiB family transcriptional regulator n=1 Tax=Actinophytocola glycyrrhizae TaxID=2044873 RepID=A0ABV9RXX9_9PSEU